MVGDDAVITSSVTESAERDALGIAVILVALDLFATTRIARGARRATLAHDRMLAAVKRRARRASTKMEQIYKKKF